MLLSDNFGLSKKEKQDHPVTEAQTAGSRVKGHFFFSKFKLAWTMVFDRLIFDYSPQNSQSKGLFPEKKIRENLKI